MPPLAGQCIIVPRTKTLKRIAFLQLIILCMRYVVGAEMVTESRMERISHSVVRDELLFLGRYINVAALRPRLPLEISDNNTPHASVTYHQQRKIMT